MPLAADLIEDGWMQWFGLCEEVGKLVHVHELTLSSQLGGPVGRLRVLLINKKLIVLPEDHKWVTFYHPDLVPFLAAYYKWTVENKTRFGRTSAIAIDNFFESYHLGFPWALRFLPKGARTRVEQMLTERGVKIMPDTATLGSLAPKRRLRAVR